MPLGEAASLWRAYLAAFTQLLSRMAGDPNSAAGKRLACLFTEALQLWGTLMCSRPARTTAVMRHLLVQTGPALQSCTTLSDAVGAVSVCVAVLYVTLTD